MEPLSALVIAVLAGGYFAKKITQDAVFAIRGEEPPSYQREMRRYEDAQKRRARKAEAKAEKKARRAAKPKRRGLGALIANAWYDAMHDAEEYRDRTWKKHREKRHEEWARQDEMDALHKEALEEHTRREQERIKAERAAHAENREREQLADEFLTRAPCEKCGRHTPVGELAVLPVDGHAKDLCPSCAEGARRAAEQVRSTCGRCGQQTLIAELMPVGRDGMFTLLGLRDDADLVCRTCAFKIRHGDKTAEPEQTDEKREEEKQEEKPAQPISIFGSPNQEPDQGNANIIPIRPTDNTARETPLSTTNTTTTNTAAPSGEIIGLGQAIAYAEQMTAKAGEGVTATERVKLDGSDLGVSCGTGAKSLELAVSSLSRGDVSGAPLAAFNLARERMIAAQAKYTEIVASAAQAHEEMSAAKTELQKATEELRKQLNVTDQYRANADAGDKPFVTNI